MSDYIEREAIRNALYEVDAITMRGVAIINQFPAADVRPVVTCGECENWERDWKTTGAEDYHFCPVTGLFRAADWFCAAGRRKDTPDEALHDLEKNRKFQRGEYLNEP